jgi:hypothetical protein
MKLLKLGVLCAVPALLLAQGPIAASIDTPANALEQTVIAPSASVRTPISPVTPFVPLTPREKTARRAFRLVEPLTLLNSAFSAGIGQLRNDPAEWGHGADGYAHRFADAEGFTAAHNTIALGFDLAFHLDPRYRRTPDGRFGPRLWSAISQTFLANKDSGGRTINVSEIAGNLGAGFISNTWQPEGHRSNEDALMSGLAGLGYQAAKNVVREFLPDVLHRVKH